MTPHKTQDHKQKIVICKLHHCDAVFWEKKKKKIQTAYYFSVELLFQGQNNNKKWVLKG